MMKSLLTVIVALLLMCSCKSMEAKLALKKSRRNENQATKQFLVKMLHANRLYLLQGKLLKERGTTESIRTLADSIVADRTRLIQNIEAIAVQEKIHLPTNVSMRSKATFTQLTDKKGREFDKKFIKMLTSNFKTDIAWVNKMTLVNVKINSVASAQIAIDRMHVEKIEMLRQQQYEKHFSMRAKYRAWNRGYLFSLVLGKFLI